MFCSTIIWISDKQEETFVHDCILVIDIFSTFPAFGYLQLFSPGKIPGYTRIAFHISSSN